MEPQNCTARIDGDKVDLWAPSQGPDISLGIAADIAGVPKANVTVHRLYLGGGFGRRGISQDYVRLSMLIAKQMPGRAVKMVWSRKKTCNTTSIVPRQSFGNVSRSMKAAR